MMSAMSHPVTLHRTLGERLEKARKINGWNQQDVATRLGISRRSITRYEDDATVPTLAVLIAWAKVCDVPFEWLINDTIPTHGTDTSPVTLGNPAQLDLFPLLIADFVPMPELLAA
jgi:transcriptional regulator with XRE-family HTH domain